MNHDTIEAVYRTLAVNVSFLTQSRGREQSNIYPVKHIFGKHALMFGSFHVWSLIILNFVAILQQTPGNC